jgi:UDP-glucose 4-epimerase
MKVLVTGGAGFIGSNLVDRLLELGHSVTVIDNESTDCHDSFYWNENSENYKYDICDYDDIEPLFKDVDCVFHLAAEARIQPAIHNPTLTTKTNVYGTCNVLQAAREHGVKRFVYSSTSASYGLKNQSPVTEDMIPDCLNAYSITKVSGENLCKMFHDMYGMETVIFRYFNVYGERQPVKGQYAPVIGLFLRQYENNEQMTVVGDGLQKRDFTHVSDVVSANIKAAETENDSVFGEIFNVGTGVNWNIFDLIRMIAGDTAKFKHIPPRLAEVRISKANINKIKTLLDWNPEISLSNWISSLKTLNYK